MELLGVDGDFDARGQRKLNLVRVAEGEDHRALALQLGAIADAHNVELTLPARGDAVNRVRDQGARQPVHRGLLVVLAVDVQHAVFGFQGNAIGDQRRDLALGAFDQNLVSLDGVFDARGQRNEFLSYTRHRINPSSGLRVPAGQIHSRVPLQPVQAIRPAYSNLQPLSSKALRRGALTTLRRAARRLRLHVAPDGRSLRPWAWS